jgi:hypothetical protein
MSVQVRCRSLLKSSLQSSMDAIVEFRFLAPCHLQKCDEVLIECGFPGCQAWTRSRKSLGPTRVLNLKGPRRLIVQCYEACYRMIMSNFAWSNQQGRGAQVWQPNDQTHPRMPVPPLVLPDAGAANAGSSTPVARPVPTTTAADAGTPVPTTAADAVCSAPCMVAAVVAEQQPMEGAHWPLHELSPAVKRPRVEIEDIWGHRWN